MPFIRRRSHNQVRDDIPTSSMADIAFLLIVFFMVTLTFAAQKGLDFGLPPEDEGEVIDPVESVLVEVLADGGLRIDQRPTTLPALLTDLRPKLRRNPRKPVIVKTSPEAPYGSMVEVFDTLRQGKARLYLDEEIAIVLPTEREMAAFW